MVTPTISHKWTIYLETTWEKITTTTTHALDLYCQISIFLMFGSARTEWGHLANLQLTWHSYHQEVAVLAVRAVSLHSLNYNAGMKQYECGPPQPLL
jgi:hypothetical protein